MDRESQAVFQKICVDHHQYEGRCTGRYLQKRWANLFVEKFAWCEGPVSSKASYILILEVLSSVIRLDNYQRAATTKPPCFEIFHIEISERSSYPQSCACFESVIVMYYKPTPNCLPQAVGREKFRKSDVDRLNNDFGGRNSSTQKLWKTRPWIFEAPEKLP